MYSVVDDTGMIPSLCKLDARVQKRKRKLFSDEYCIEHVINRSRNEPITTVYEFPSYTNPMNVAALASVCKRLRDRKTPMLRKLFPFVAAFDKTDELPPSIDDTKSDDEIDILALDLIERMLSMLRLNGFSVSYGDIIFVSTTPGEPSEAYHRDGGADDTTFRMIIYGTDYGPGTYFADGDCNLLSPNDDRVRETTNSTGFAPEGWDPKAESLQEVYIKPNGGNAVVFTGNVCHKRESSSNSRWGILINMVRHL